MSDVPNEIAQALEENLALKAVCATLLVEIALKDPDPRMKLATLTAGLQGMAHGVASQVNSAHVTKTIDAICTMAECALVDTKKP